MANTNTTTTQQPASVSSYRSEALSLIERNLVRAVEADRKAIFQTLAEPGNQGTFAGLVGRLGLEAANQYSLPPERVASYVNQGIQVAIDHYNSVVHREDRELPELVWSPVLSYLTATPLEPLLPVEVIRLIVVSLFMQAAGADGVAIKTQALAIIERNVTKSVERLRKETTGEVGRMHNEITNGLTIPTARMRTFVSQATTEIVAHQDFLQRTDDDDIPPPPATFEQKRLLVESYIAALAGQVEVATATKKLAMELIERDSTANDQTVRRKIRSELAQSSPSSYGYCWGRVGLGFTGALDFSNEAIKRAVTGAEESLMNSGKWVGTVADYSFTIDHSQIVYLPREVETVLFATFDGDPRPVHDRFAEYMRGGTGIKSEADPHRSGFQDRGEGYALTEIDVTPIETMITVTTCDDDIRLKHNGVVLYDGRGNRDSKTFTILIENCAVGDRIGVELFDGWAPMHGLGGWQLDVKYRITRPDGTQEVVNVNHNNGISIPLTASYHQVPPAPEGSWPSGSYWGRTPAYADYYDAGEVIIRPPTYDVGPLKRKYFVSVPKEGTETLVRYLAKLRFVPHFSNTDNMFLRNQEAMFQAAVAILTEGKLGQFDAATKLLSAQVYQQYFKSQVWGVHNKPVRSMR